MSLENKFKRVYPWFWNGIFDSILFLQDDNRLLKIRVYTAIRIGYAIGEYVASCSGYLAKK